LNLSQFSQNFLAPDGYNTGAIVQRLLTHCLKDSAF
jgi:hypothetical protein